MNIIQPRRGKKYLVVIPGNKNDPQLSSVVDCLEAEFGIKVVATMFVLGATAFQFIEVQENHNLAAITPGSLKK